MSLDLQFFVACMMIITLGYTSFCIREELFKNILIKIGLALILTITTLGIWKMV